MLYSKKSKVLKKHRLSSRTIHLKFLVYFLPKIYKDQLKKIIEDLPVIESKNSCKNYVSTLENFSDKGVSNLLQQNVVKR